MTTAPERIPARSEGVARRARGLIAEQQLEQRQVAHALGMTQPSLSRRVNGVVPFSIDEIDQLADFLGVSAEYLCGFTDSRNPRPENPDGGGVRHQGLEPRTR